MRYAETHKSETRRRLVRAAAGAVRARGPEGVSVAQIMAELDLTHGGFYAHFPNKQALVVAAIAEAFDQGHRRFGRLTESMDRETALAAFIDAYVSTAHRDSPERGCPIAILAGDLPRQGSAVRKAFDAGVAAMLARIAGWLPPGDDAARHSLANSLMAEMAGAVALSRALSDTDVAARLLDDCRGRIKARAGLSEGASSSENG
ncbi:TetR/AcrR family transcriptional regulator [Phenylobacterium sp.]|uniref:TetR/AcrR family transcriptional regulator n=1 Tax=Phenylobacterium sp. TaxID=1871053 RepID=UPI003983C760